MVALEAQGLAFSHCRRSFHSRFAACSGTIFVKTAVIAPDKQREEAIFQAALERPAKERVEYVRTACAGDRDSQDRVLSLLRADIEAEGFLENLASNPALANLANAPPSTATVRLADVDEKPGDHVGRYK